MGGPYECLRLGGAWWTVRIRAAKRAWQGRGRKGVRLWPSEAGSLFLTRFRISCTLSCHGGWYERTAALLVQHMCAGLSFLQRLRRSTDLEMWAWFSTTYQRCTLCAAKK